MNPIARTLSRLLTILALFAAAGTFAQEPDKQRFDIHEFQVEGNTVLGNEAIERAVYPFMGDGRDIDDVERARTALEKTYHDAGFGTVAIDIPPQKVIAGVVRLNVVQGTISRLRVVGSRYFSQDRIVELVPGLAEGGVPNLNEVQQQLALVNTSPDERVTPLLRPGKLPGTTEVDLQVEDELPLHGGLEINNGHAPDTTALRTSASLRYANLFQRGHTAGLQVQVSPEDASQVKVFVGTYSMPLDGGTLLLSAVKSDSASYVGPGIGVFGSGKVFGARYVMPLESEKPAELQQSLTLGVDYKDSQQSLALTDGTGIDTPIHYVPFSLSYAATTFDPRGSSEYSTGVVFAVRDFGSRQQQFADKRYLAHADFSLLKFSAARTQKLPGDTTLFGEIEGQFTDDPLVSNEQFVAGGLDSLRGYLESTAVGDIALRGTLEFRTPNFRGEKSRVDFLQFRTFFDTAWLRTLKPLPGTRPSYELSSYGLGLTARARPGFMLRADLAWPMNTVGAQSAYQPRVQASATYQF
ncbi:MAG: BamA/TamA family outer membrane protein [Pseudomonadota bacterium]|nr:BamA/TamA family outer membrane protein [Pseudomonadota bacterium]